MRTHFLKTWMDSTKPDSGVSELVVLEERAGIRDSVQSTIEAAVKDHLAGLDIIERIGNYDTALAYIRNKLPPSKRARSGDFAEILASEYVDQLTEYRVPIKKLRWKDDRVMAMRGNDLIAIRKEKQHWCLLKGESKSRAKLSDNAVIEAVEGLNKHAGRPNPSSLAFISSRLREQNRDAEAAVFEDFQSRPPKLSEIEHMVFTLSGNNPTACLKKYCQKGAVAPRHLIGCVIPDHQQFIAALFDRIYAGNSRPNL